MKTPLEVFDDYYAPDDAWAQKCRADLAAALALLGAPSTPEGARLIAAAPRMLEELQRVLDTMPLGSAWARETADRVGALLRDLHGDPS